MAKRHVPGGFKKRGEVFYYVTRIKGRDYVRSTAETTLRGAQARQEEFYRDALAWFESTTALATTSEKTLKTWGEATRAYWDKVGVFHDGGAPDRLTIGSKNTLWSLEWLEDRIGTNTLLESIDGGTAQEIKAKRRGETSKHGRSLANSTVNRSVIQPMRAVLLYAREFGRAQVQRIQWKTILMAEPEERVRELEAQEEDNLFAALRHDYHDLVDIAVILGLRQGEAILKLRWHHIGWGTMTITIPGKGNRTDVMQLPATARDILWRRKAELSPASDDELVFSYVAQRSQSGKAVNGKRTIKGERIKGQRYPVTKSGLRREFKRALKAAGIVNFRYHDLRHTFATRLLRESNLKQVQKQARHRNIDTTLKYAHVLDAEMRDSMERAAQASPRRAGTALAQPEADAETWYKGWYNEPGDAKEG